MDQLLRLKSPLPWKLRRLDHSPTTVRDTPKGDTQPISGQTNIQSKKSDTPPTSNQTNIQAKSSEPWSDYFWGPWYDAADFLEDEQHATARMLSDDEIMLPLEEMKVLRRRLYNSQFNEARIRDLTAECQRLTERLERAEEMIDRSVTHVEVLLDLLDKERAKSSRNEEITGNTLTTRQFVDEKLTSDPAGEPQP